MEISEVTGADYHRRKIETDPAYAQVVRDSRRKWRQAAGDLRIPFTGTIGVLELAADQGFIDLQDAFGRLKNTDFWISHQLLVERLKLHLARKRQV